MTKTSVSAFVSSEMRFVASLPNAMTDPSPDSDES